MAHRSSFTEDYDFFVRRGDDFEDNPNYGYSVSLPHQCDDWEIIGAEDDDSIAHDDSCPPLPLSKKFAIKQMELFIRRANEALEKLKLL